MRPDPGRRSAAAPVPPSGWRHAKSVFGLTSMRLSGTVLAFASAALLAFRFGAGATADAFFLAYRFMNNASQPLGQLLKIVTIPSIVDARQSGGREAHRTWTRPALYIVLGSLVVSTAAAFAAPQVVRLLAPGFETERAALAARVFRVFLFLLPAALVLSVAVAVHNAARHFTRAAFLEELPRWLMLAVLVLLVPPLGVVGVSWAFVLGTLLATVLLVPGLRAALLPDREREESPRAQGGAEVATLWIRYLPLLIWHVGTVLANWINFAYVSTAPEGSISVLVYGERLARAAPSALSAALASIMYVELAHRTAQENGRSANAVLARFLRISFFVLLPILGFFIAASGQIVQLLLGRGAFGPDSVAATSAVLRAVAISVAFAFFVRCMIYRMNLGTSGRIVGIVLFASTVSLLVHWTANAMLVPRLAATGAALATTFSSATGMLMMGRGVAREFGHFMNRREWGSIGRTLAAAGCSTLAMGGVGAWLTRDSSGQIIVQALHLALIAFLGCFVYLVVAWVVRHRELDESWQILRRALAGREPDAPIADPDAD